MICSTDKYRPTLKRKERHTILRGEFMDMDFAKIMQMMNGGGGGNKDMSMLMQMLPQLMNNSSGAQNRQTPPAQINLNPEEVNKTINKLYNDND